MRHALDDADRQIAVARSVIAGHRGWIGADARTRLAEAERTRNDAEPLATDEDSREEGMALARRSGALASEALQLAQRDIDSSRPQDPGWGGQGGGVKIDYRPVHAYTLTDEIDYIKPKKRVY